MEIKPAEELLVKDGEPLSLVPLHALSTVREPYRTLLFQPAGPIEGTNQRVGHQDQKVGQQKSAAFLRLCVEQVADLAVAPEYSVSWTAIDAIRTRTYVPPKGAMWVLGCESIHPTDLENVRSAFNQVADTVFVHEGIDAKQAAQKAYIDPLLYVFWTEDSKGREILSVVAQFKTTPCRDKLDVEQQSLYRGRNVYTFNRGHNRIALLAIICSDAFDFTSAFIDDYHSNSLLIHIQLNPKPAHADYAAYRQRLCSVGTSNKVELLCLNWAASVKEKKDNGALDDWKNVSGSAWYAPGAAFSGDDALINAAHARGLYYSVLAKRWHVFFLSSEEHVVQLRKQKVLVHPEPEALHPRTHIAVEERWEWSQQAQAMQPGFVANDGFATAVMPYQALAPLLPAAQADPLAVERALELLAGPAGKPTSWYQVNEMQSLQVDTEESVRRVTVHQDPVDTSAGTLFRKSRLQRAQDALTLPGNAVPWPMPLRHLEHGYRLCWSKQHPHHNIEPNAGEYGSAALVYLSEQADENVPERFVQKIREAVLKEAVERAISEGTDVNDAIVRAQDRMCIVYRRDHQFRVMSPAVAPTIDSPASATAVDIAGE